MPLMAAGTCDLCEDGVLTQDLIQVEYNPEERELVAFRVGQESPIEGYRATVAEVADDIGAPLEGWKTLVCCWSHFPEVAMKVMISGEDPRG